MTVSPIAVATEFVRAIGRQDVDALAELMTVDHRFIDSLGNMAEGREKMRAGWTDYFRMVPDYALAIEETYTEGPVVLLLGMAQGTYSSDGTLKTENRWHTPVAIRAFVKDGKLIEWRVYADNEPIRKLMSKT
ncbi:nuclear transport factor 2 family protein [Terracidiphilus sp.]|jgi:ketosteroid isomerase-like protein|uniref:nuclear transport factor 2 family protein n=1 Tax=Terracidiphilus sp. TaxID=1964191 RepID=UPI003C1A4C89